MPQMPSTRRVLVVAGTRPECLKVASVVTALRRHAGTETILANSGQHAAMVERTLAHLGLRSDLALEPVVAATLSHAVADLRRHVLAAIRAANIDLVIAQGDTSTAYATALASRDAGVPLAHVEAGLRTPHPYRPFPEQLFRRRIARLARIHYAPTVAACANLVAEGIDPAAIVRVGNTIVDLLREQVEAGCREPRVGETLLLTLHRRENYGRGLDHVCAAVLELIGRHPTLGVVCPLHPNPAIRSRIRRNLGGVAGIDLVEPLDYAPFIAELARARLVITDSGGIQEEAPYLGAPVLVVRENTERPESLALGTSILVAPQVDAIVAAASRMLDAPRPRACAFDADAPFGDGRSGERIAAHLQGILRHDATRPIEPLAVNA
ncbi:MAG: UDP-N-acetylglucosamine 2-epimerase (non-hydrolyzing) [Xanthomonadales bacterium]|nr:UDP-N-acetylglucosamine 2-epimerase (non-hydrolyzing) [Xanthomonadales bacterium]